MQKKRKIIPDLLGIHNFTISQFYYLKVKIKVKDIFESKLCKKSVKKKRNNSRFIGNFKISQFLLFNSKNKIVKNIFESK